MPKSFGSRCYFFTALKSTDDSSTSLFIQELLSSIAVNKEYKPTITREREREDEDQI